MGKLAVDLDLGERHALQLREPRLAHAKIIHGEFEPLEMQAHRHVEKAHDAAGDFRLRDLQRDRLRRNVGAAHHGLDELRQVEPFKGACGEVDRHPQRVPGAMHPTRECDRFGERVLHELRREIVRTFHGGHERRRLKETERRVTPADESLDANHAARSQLHLGLVEQLQFAPAEGIVDLAFGSGGGTDGRRRPTLRREVQHGRQIVNRDGLANRAQDTESLQTGQCSGDLDYVIGLDAHDHDGRLDAERREGADGFDAVALGHAEVAEDQIEAHPRRAHQRKGLPSTARLDDVADVEFTQRRAHRGAHGGLIVDDEDTHVSGPRKLQLHSCVGVTNKRPGDLRPS